MNVEVALAALVAAWVLAAATAAPSTSSAAAATFAHQSAPGSPFDVVVAAKERHGLHNSIRVHEEIYQRSFPQRSSRRRLVNSWSLENKHSQNLPHKKNIFVMTNDCKEGLSDPKPTDQKLRIFRADGTEVIFGMPLAILRSQYQDEMGNVGFKPCTATTTKSGPPRADLNRDNKVFIYELEKQARRANIPHAFISPRSSQFQRTSKEVDTNQAAGEINMSKAFSQRQGRIKADKSLTQFLLSHFNGAGAEHHVTKRSPLELGLVQGLAAVTHHGSAAPASTHHSVVLHPPTPPKPPHAVQVSALHDVAGLVTHAVIDPGLHITSTTVLTHDKPLLPHEEPPPPAHHEVVIPVVVKHEVVALAHPAAAAHSLFRAHVGGFGVGLDFGGHGAGHGFYAAASAFAFR